MKKLYFSIFLSFMLVINSIPMPCFASTASASNVEKLNTASSSNIGYDEDYLEEQIRKLSSYSVMSLSDTSDTDDYPYPTVYTLPNTVSPDGCQVIVVYMNTSGQLKVSKAFPVSLHTWTNGGKWLRFDIKTADMPDDFQYVSYYAIQWGANSLPSTGKYNMNFGVFCTEVPRTMDKIAFYTRKYLSNATYQESFDYLPFIVNGTTKQNMVATQTVDFSNISYGEFRLYPQQGWNTQWTFVAGAFAIRLEKVSPDTNSDITTAGGSYTSGDAASDTANNTSQIAQNTSDMNDTLKEIVGTISNQLAALWDQMYNIMHLRQLANDDKNTDRIIDKQSEQIENDNANTEQVTGAIEQHGNFIIEGLKSLFIPSDEFFKSYFDDLYGWFSDRFGFLSFPIDLLVKFSDLILSTDEADCIITLPSFEIMGEQLLQEQSFNLTDFLEENFMVVLTALRMVTSIMLIMAFVNLCGDKWDEVMKN